MIQSERLASSATILNNKFTAKAARIILFGETEITKDYRRQIDSQGSVAVEFGREYVKNFKPRPYCEIVATVDEHPDEFDDTVVDAERLKARDYDAIVLCTFPQSAQAAYNKIAQIVPDMANRIIYNIQVVQM